MIVSDFGFKELIECVEAGVIPDLIEGEPIIEGDGEVGSELPEEVLEFFSLLCDVSDSGGDLIFGGQVNECFEDVVADIKLIVAGALLGCGSDFGFFRDVHDCACSHAEIGIGGSYFELSEDGDEFGVGLTF